MRLRPIGTEFTENFPASMFTTDDRPTRMTFRVVAHIETMNGMAEEVKAIRSQKLPAPTVIPRRAFQSIGHWYEWSREYANSFP